MRIKSLLLFAIFFLCSCLILKGQMTKEDICNIYSLIVYDLKDNNLKDYNEKETFVNNKIIINEDFVQYLKAISPLFENELEKRNIDYQKFLNTSEIINLDSCFNKKIKLISEGKFRNKYMRYKKKSMGICYLSNISYYDNFAFVHVAVELSYGRTFGNFYFFVKEENWKLLYSRTEVD